MDEQPVHRGSVAVSSGGGLGPATGSSRGSLQGKLIAVDPGHGGNDPGMIGTTHGTEEKDLTLSTSKLLAEELRSLGARVVMTRTKDGEKPALPERVKTAADAEADAFVSVHYNSAKNQASGTLVFYYSKSKDAPLAHAVEGRLQGLSLRSNGIAFGDYHVLRENRLPSVLVELGFLSNAKDEKEARTASYQKAAAKAIAEGFRIISPASPAERLPARLTKEGRSDRWIRIRSSSWGCSCSCWPASACCCSGVPAAAGADRMP